MRKENQIASLTFFTNYKDGMSNDEIMHDILTIILQIKETMTFSRSLGCNITFFEQSQYLNTTLFKVWLIEEIYKLNVMKKFKPFIVIGYNDIVVEGSNLTIYYRTLSNINSQEMINVNL